MTKWKAACLFPLLMLLTMGGVVTAQTDRKVTITMLDSKTGQPIVTSELEVRTKNSLGFIEVKPNKNGIGELNMPADVSVIAVHAQDGWGGWFFMNCDANKDRGSSSDHWYSVFEILATGVVAPNSCNRRQAAAKPGEFAFFVRRATFWEKMRE